jgi:quercetin 2,3-dioxygenase
MMTLRRSEARGHADHGWLDTYHTFSFADYHDPAEMGFGALRVINDDRVAPGTGFGTHGHRDMEIITYILDGALEHKDSMGNGSVIRPGDVQRMSAGTGVRHSEFNPSPDQPVRLLQVWIEPDAKGIQPGYEQKHFPDDNRRGRLKLIAAPDGRDGSVTVHQDARVYAGLLNGDDRIEHVLESGRRAYVHVARGSVEVNGAALEVGDGLKVSGEFMLELARARDAEVLVFDLP